MDVGWVTVESCSGSQIAGGSLWWMPCPSLIWEGNGRSRSEMPEHLSDWLGRSVDSIRGTNAWFASVIEFKSYRGLGLFHNWIRSFMSHVTVKTDHLLQTEMPDTPVLARVSDSGGKTWAIAKGMQGGEPNLRSNSGTGEKWSDFVTSSKTSGAAVKTKVREETMSSGIQGRDAILCGVT